MYLVGMLMGGVVFFVLGRAWTAVQLPKSIYHLGISFLGHLWAGNHLKMADRLIDHLCHSMQTF